MQKKGKEVLVEVDGKPETTFFAAQRYFIIFTPEEYMIIQLIIVQLILQIFNRISQIKNVHA